MVLKNQSYRYRERDDGPAFPFLRSQFMNAQLQAVVAPMPSVTHPLLDPGALVRSALTVIDTEARAIEVLKGRINDAFLRACQLMFECPGRIVVSGMGKSGHIARKIAATLASTGTPAFFVHPGEASHGDLGMITQKDVVLALSNSGETDELLTILPVIKRQGIPLIAMTGNNDSSLAAMGDVHLDVSVPAEACPLGLAPTASTTAALVMGDALAIALLEARGFTDEDFARSHPAGSLGRRLLLHISDIMHTGEQIPSVGADASLSRDADGDDAQRPRHDRDRRCAGAPARRVHRRRLAPRAGQHQSRSARDAGDDADDGEAEDDQSGQARDRSCAADGGAQDSCAAGCRWRTIASSAR